MPRVPVIEAPQVQQAAARPDYSNVRAPRPTPADFGAAVGEGMQQVSSGLSHAAKVVEQEMAKADVASATGLEVGFKDQVNETLSGFRTLKGKNAIDAAGATVEQIEKAREQVISKAQVSERARNLARKATDGDVLRAKDIVRGHTAQQGEVVQEASFEARRVSGLKAITNAAFTPKVRDEEIRAGAEKVVERAKVLGLDAAATKAMVEAWHQDASTAVLQSLVAARNTEGARLYFEQNREQLGTKAPHFEALVAQMKQSDAAESESIALTDGARDKETGWVDEELALRGLDTLPRELRDEARPRLEHRLAMEAKFKKQEVDRMFDSVLTDVLQGGGFGSIDPEERRWLETRAPREWKKIKLAVLNEARARRASSVAELRAISEMDQRALETFNKLPDVERAEFNVNDLVGTASTKMRNVILDKKKAAATRVQKGLSIPEDDFRRSVRLQGEAAGLDPKDVEEGLPAFVNRMDAWWDQFPADKKPTAADVKKRQADELLKGKTKKRFWNTEKHKFQVPNEEIEPLEGEEQPSPLNKGYKKATAGAPVKVELVGPNGRTGRMPEGDELEKFIAEHPGWRRK